MTEFYPIHPSLSITIPAVGSLPQKNKFISYHAIKQTVKKIDEKWSILDLTMSRVSSLPPYAVLVVVSKRKSKTTSH